MGLKTVGTLTWEACTNCQNYGVGAFGKIKCDNPSLYQEGDSNNVGCADYLSNEESEE